ncbi:hypothetical protein [Hymenobacter sp. B81]|uniref:hypothetical protein n=1 Tax=Hymenobacter sp. B81 TaxID=3344878 RepID=UPI0037DCB3A0
MKALYSLMCGLLLAGSLVAGAVTDDPTLEVRATAQSRQMARAAQLSEGQYLKVRSLTLALLVAEQTAKVAYLREPARLDQHLAELRHQYEWDLAAVLWPRQLAALKQTQTSVIAVSGR